MAKKTKNAQIIEMTLQSSFIEPTDVCIITIPNTEHTINMCKTISLAERESFVNAVVGEVLENGYKPELFEFSFKKNVIKTFTDYPIEACSPEQAYSICRSLLYTAIENSLPDSVNSEIVNMRSDILHKLDFYCQVAMQPTKLDDMCEKISALADSIAGIVEKVSGIADQYIASPEEMQKLTAAVSELGSVSKIDIADAIVKAGGGNAS